MYHEALSMLHYLEKRQGKVNLCLLIHLSHSHLSLLWELC